MMKARFILSVLGFMTITIFPRDLVAQSFSITVKDNLAQMNMEQLYRLTGDSLIITGKSDYGRSDVNYLQRALTPKEKKEIYTFLKAFPLDSLKKEYFVDYSNYNIIDQDHYPRSVDLEVNMDGKRIISRATNAWVGLYVRFFEGLNRYLPEEVRIVMDKNKFNAFY